MYRSWDSDMPDFDVQGFVADVERLGLMLRALPLADGSIRLNLWRMPNAIIHAQRIEALWALRIGENQDRVQQLAAHVMQRDAERPAPASASPERKPARLPIRAAVPG
jgi:uncharacterized protein involved in outer membrane biogenesis